MSAFLRTLIRLWFVSVLGLAILMAASVAYAQQQPRTETGSGGGSNDGDNRSLLRNRQGARQVNPETFIDFLYSDTIRREINEGRRTPIMGRDDEVMRISNGLDDMNRVVAVQGDPKSGRSAAVDQYIYLNPSDTVYRVKSKELSELQPPSERARVMNEIIKLIEARAAANRGQGRLVMYVDNLPLLDIGHLADYKASKSIVQAVAQGRDIGMILETDARTMTLLGQENQHFKSVAKVIELRPAELDPILDYLRRERAALERRAGVQFTEQSLIESARQAQRYFAADTFNAAQRLLLIAAREFRDNRAGSPTALARANQELARVKLEISSIQADLQAQDNAESRQRLAERMEQQTEIEGRIAGLRTSVIQTGNAISDLEYQIRNLKQQRTELAAPWHRGWFGRSNAQQTLDKEITAKTTELEALKKARVGMQGTAGPLPDRVTPDFVHLASSQETGLKLETVAMDIRTGTARLAEINDEIFGNEERVERVQKRMARYVKEMEEEENERRRNPRQERPLRGKPIQSVLSGGPTGTAKTDLYLKVAAKLGMPVVKIDFTNYTQSHQGSGLIGAKPEYVGHGQPGELTGPVLKTPYVMIILDEITRGHIDVIKQVVYPILDVGYIKDSEGRTVSFEKAFIVGTSNAAEAYARMSRPQLLEELKKVEREWTPSEIESKSTNELRVRVFEWELKLVYHWEESMVGRFGLIEVTEPHTPEVIEKIAHKQVKKLVNKFKSRNIQIVFSETALRALVATYDPTKGARSLENAFGNLISDKVYDLFIDGRTKPGDVVMVDNFNGAWDLVVGTQQNLEAARAVGDPIAAERRQRVQEALARQAERGQPAQQVHRPRIFEESYMIRNAVAKALRGFGRR